MKKLIALVLAVLLCFCFVACGNSDAGEENEQTLNQEQPTAAATETATTAPAQETETVPAETEPASGFDTSWASNEFEALLPELPFTGWTTSQQSDTVYEMELGGLNDTVLTDDEGNTIGYGEDKEALIAYLESLMDYGFSVEETGGIEGYAYEWMVVDPSGNEIEVVCAEGYCWITITKVN